MARVTYSPLIADLRGKAADAVFSSWKGRGYVRQRVIPANPNSAGQQAVRNSMAEIVSMWQNISEDLKDGYGVGAAQLSISGYNDFAKLNRAALQAASGLYGPRRNTAATAPRITVPTDVAYDSEPTGTTMAFTWTNSGNGAGHYMGWLAYDATDNEVLDESLEVVLESAETATVDPTPSGHVILVAAFIIRASDGEMVHCGSFAHTQT